MPSVTFNRERWAALAGAILLTIALPIAIDQGYFRYNPYVLPGLGAIATLLYLRFFLTSSRAIEIAKRFRYGFCVQHRVPGVILFVAIFGLVGCLFGAAWYLVLEKSKEHVAEILKSETSTPRQETPQGKTEPPITEPTASGTATLAVTPAPKSKESKKPLPADQAFHEKLPEEVYFSLGEHGITTEASLKSLTEEKSTLFNLGGFVPVKFHLENGVIYCDVKIWGGPAGPSIELVHNEFTVKPPNWDRNFSANALEVVDEQGTPIFQLIRKTPSHYVMNGLMPIPGGGFILATEKGAQGIRLPLIPPGTLKPIFKYPSWKYPGQYAE